MSIFKNHNEETRQEWLQNTLYGLPQGAKILDAGAGELKNKKHCYHLNYISQDFAQYHGTSGGGDLDGINPTTFDPSQVDIVSDITDIPEPDASYDAILCSEVLEHIPEPTHAFDEFARLLKPGGILILTAPFSSNVHFAPYHFCTGFSKYFYEYHLPMRGFTIRELKPNGDWFMLLRQEITRLGGLERQRGNWSWPLAYLYALLGLFYFTIRKKKVADDVACYGYHCIAVKH
jgi:SAM-dependent methyltransferase